MINIELKTEQKLTLSAKMMQSAEILQMTSLELTQYLNDLALENPVIDLTVPESTMEESEKYRFLEQQSTVSYTRPETQETLDEEDCSDDWKFKEDQEESLTDYLWSQLLTAKIPEGDLAILHFILLCLDERGYLDETPEQIADCCHCSEEHIQRLLATVRQLDPAGIGAENLSDCLLLQAERLGIVTPFLETLIRFHLDDIAKNHLPAVCSRLGCTMAELSHGIQTIKGLNPKPGLAFCDRQQLSYLTPDVTVVKFKDHYDILLSDSRCPAIHMNSYYTRLAKDSDSQEVLEYLGKKIRQADWLKTCIAQRGRTLLAITQAIVEFQKDFFANGNSQLHSLRMAEVAAAAGLHESTVSRAVRGKYLQCMWGIYPLNYFFPKGIFLESCSQLPDAKQALMLLVEQEDKMKPLSDRILAELLCEKGYPISRRTVAKYRDLLGIGDASGRKQYKI